MNTAQPPQHDSPDGFTPSTIEPLAHQLLATLAQHRMATTHQLHVLLRPDRTRQSVSQQLNTLRRERLVDFAVLPQAYRTRVWYLTPKAARLTRDWPALRGRPPYPITSGSAASLKTPHTLTVLRTHLAFVADARRRGDEHGHLDWTPEVFHMIGDGERVVADAVMHYTVTSGEHSEHRRKLRAFIEVDRTTMSSERLAAKLIEYARLWSYEPPAMGRRRTAGPGWLRWYPVFPRVLFVLTGAMRPTLRNRIRDLQAMAAQHPLVIDLARNVQLGAAVLEDLEEHGATANVWVPLAGGEKRAWSEL
ncbi:replication-relaxation family protein [Streptomyces sp. Tue6028]|uniref:replication-relaxation family protein n=1 Tax=Streptomyces sp. Tue6028 TaxID=2036037 RepID=UPI003EBA8148